jgi:hypothetical protein
MTFEQMRQKSSMPRPARFLADVALRVVCTVIALFAQFAFESLSAALFAGSPRLGTPQWYDFRVVPALSHPARRSASGGETGLLEGCLHVRK